MRILYVTAITKPLAAIFRGETEITGLPAFYYPLKLMLQAGHTVDFVLITNHFTDDINIRTEGLSKNNIKSITSYSSRSKSRWKGLVQRVTKYMQFSLRAYRTARNGNYDFIYFRANESWGPQFLIRGLRIPNGLRKYGDEDSTHIKELGELRAIRKRPMNYLCYKTAGDFVLVTDDNPKGGYIVKKWLPRKKKTDFYIWKTGIEFLDINDIKSSVSLPEHDYLLYAARFEYWKQQHLVVDVLNNIHKAGRKIHLYFVGQQDDIKYVDHVKSLVDSFRLNEYVHFLGPVKKQEIAYLAYHAFANLFAYDFSNLGNVFYETFVIGGVVVAIDHGSLDDFVVNGHNGFLARNPVEAGEVIVELMKKPELLNEIRKNAKKTAKEKFLSVEQRFGLEVKLLEAYAAGNAKDFPKKL